MNDKGRPLAGFYKPKGANYARAAENDKERLYVKLRDARAKALSERPQGWRTSEGVTDVPITWSKNGAKNVLDTPHLRRSVWKNVTDKNIGTFANTDAVRKILPIDPKAQSYLQFSLAPSAF